MLDLECALNKITILQNQIIFASKVNKKNGVTEIKKLF